MRQCLLSFAVAPTVPQPRSIQIQHMYYTVWASAPAKITILCFKRKDRPGSFSPLPNAEKPGEMLVLHLRNFVQPRRNTIPGSGSLVFVIAFISTRTRNKYSKFTFHRAAPDRLDVCPMKASTLPPLKMAAPPPARRAPAAVTKGAVSGETPPSIFDPDRPVADQRLHPLHLLSYDRRNEGLAAKPGLTVMIRIRSSRSRHIFDRTFPALPG